MERWYAAAFFAQQAAEKALKALFIVNRREESPKTHNLVAIAELLRAPDHILAGLRRIGPVYTIARYPDAANGLPVKMFNRAMAEQAVQDAQDTVQWVAQNLPSQ
ncbi:MAG: HEPN domain-containing protein [Dehalococcoidia bacterium]|nr:HEPN domain-containing protein [Dehalococcoidia bacterium]